MMKATDLDYSGNRLRLTGSRVEKVEQTGQDLVHGALFHGDKEGIIHKQRKYEVPKFERAEAATSFELFYDLWFVANLSVFTGLHEIVDIPAFSSFIGYIVLLWTTWLLTSLYDVRYAADSVFERICKAIHLGVMIGFAEVGAHFDPTDQISSVFRTMSIFLAISRLVLSVQYGFIAFQLRKFHEGMRPLLFTTLVHFCASMIYLGISFRYNLRDTSRVYLVWYIGGLLEMAVLLMTSQLSTALTFIGTHLGERLNLLTLVILGEGCIIVAKSVTLLVKDTYLKDETTTTWSPGLIGVVTSAVSLLYIIFQLYFDWMHEEEHSMSKRHQVWWASIHLPFHIALILLLEGANLFIRWVRIKESLTILFEKVIKKAASLPDDHTSEDVSNTIGEIVYEYLEKYPPLKDGKKVYDDVQEQLDTISELPESFWGDSSPDDTTEATYENSITELLATCVNGIFAAFEIEAPEQVEASSAENLESENTVAIEERFHLVFMYAFACAGIVLLFLTVMHIISKPRGWSPFNIARTAICIMMSIALSLLTIVGVVAVYGDKEVNVLEGFLGSVWMLPTITIAYFCILVITHIPHPPFWLGHTDYHEIEGLKAQEDIPFQSLRHDRDESASHGADDENTTTQYSSAYGYGNDCARETPPETANADRIMSYMSSGNESIHYPSSPDSLRSVEGRERTRSSDSHLYRSPSR
ncbi:hypothetical protein F5Y15DRAFT_309226 [Xylariaceae sp. FL0016]|nr:hypothetical protein F5Y15DRAFT_309226 [Xylariaceae sp. FL0016]